MEIKDMIQQITETLQEACADNCQCCQATTTNWLRELGWQWIEVEGKNAKARFGFKIGETRLDIFSKPGLLSNCQFSKKEATQA